MALCAGIGGICAGSGTAGGIGGARVAGNDYPLGSSGTGALAIYVASAGSTPARTWQRFASTRAPTSPINAEILLLIIFRCDLMIFSKLKRRKNDINSNTFSYYALNFILIFQRLPKIIHKYGPRLHLIILLILTFIL